MTGIIFDIKEFGLHDGDGLRTTVFLKGCPLRCVWCHNPEGLETKPELCVRKNGCLECGVCRRGCSHPECQQYGRCLHICPKGLISVCGREMTTDELIDRILANERVLRDGFGGVTFSGGEPLMQHSFVCEVMEKLRGRIDIAIETSGYSSTEVFSRVISLCDFVYMDIKLADDAEHKKYCGVSNKPILRNLEILRSAGIRCCLRTPLIPGINNDETHIKAITEIAGGLPHEFLPYNVMAGAKYPMFNKEFVYEKILNGSDEK